MPDWHGIIERAVDRNPVACTLIRPGSPDVSVSINVAPIQYQEHVVAAGGASVEQSRRWMIPARRLAATAFSGAPQPGDLMIFTALGEQGRIEQAPPGIAGGEVVRWDVTLVGAQT